MAFLVCQWYGCVDGTTHAAASPSGSRFCNREKLGGPHFFAYRSSVGTATLEPHRTVG